jgi:TRAP-type mannitol/chloroaromatic compound transport system permease small subunit
VNALVAIVRTIDAINLAIGRIVAWLLIPVVLLGFSVVILRYAFGLGFAWLSESFIWLHGAIVMLAAAYVLKEGGHVRVDLVYKKLSRRGRALVDVIGTWALLMPMVGVIYFMSMPIVQRSWRIGERSPTPDGLPVMYLLKSMLLVFCVLVALQGLAVSIRALLVLAGREDLAGREVA